MVQEQFVRGEGKEFAFLGSPFLVVLQHCIPVNHPLICLPSMGRSYSPLYGYM
jgi:hypothetical protein